MSCRNWCSDVFSFDLGSWCVVFFFFSSRRRHTRSDRDWSSDVCSSDLVLSARIAGSAAPLVHADEPGQTVPGAAPSWKFSNVNGPALIACAAGTPLPRSEEHTSELQSRSDLVCRLLLEKKKKHTTYNTP